MRYETVAEAYRDLEAATGRLALIDRMAELIRATPDDELARGVLPVSGPDRAAVRRHRPRPGREAGDPCGGHRRGRQPEAVTAGVRARGDLGEADGSAAAPPDAHPDGRRGGRDVARHRRGGGCGLPGAQARPAGRAAPPGHPAGGAVCAASGHRQSPARHRHADDPRRAGAGARRGQGRPAGPGAGLQHLLRPRRGRRDAGAGRVGRGRALQVQPGNPVRVMLAQRLSEAHEILARLGGECAAEYKYDGVRIQAHRTADGEIVLFTRGLERINNQFPDLVEAIDAALGPREAILEGEAVAYDAAAGELRPFQEVMFRRRKYGISEAVRDVPVEPVLLRPALRGRRGPDPAPVPAAPGAARRGPHPVRPDPADHGRRGEHPAGAGRDVRAGDRRRLPRG